MTERCAHRSRPGLCLAAALALLALPPALRPGPAAAQQGQPVAARGWVEPASGTRRISAENGGRIAAIAVRAGDKVAAGQALVQLDAADADARLQAADAVLQLREDEARAAAAPKPRRPGEPATRTREENAVSLARAERAIAAAEVARRRLVSPIAATVLDRLHEPGDVVAPGEPILLIGDLSARRIRAEVEARSVAGLMPGQVADVAPAGPAGPRVSGRITEIGQMVGRQTLPEDRATQAVDMQVVEVLVRIDGPAAATLRPGQRVDVVFGGPAPGQ